MDAMDVLGALLGRKSGSGSAGGNILKDILGGGRSQGKSQSRQHPKSQDPRSRQTSSRRPRTIGESASSLEDLLNVSNNHHQQRRQAPAPKPKRAPVQREEEMNEQAEVMVRAMVCAARSDGQITQKEQESIVQQLGEVSQAEVDFLRAEFSKPVDVREFAWSVPRGMEEQVYSISLMAIDLDEQKEAEYLADLAHGLRLDPSRCNDIHRNYGAPVIFQT